MWSLLRFWFLPFAVLLLSACSGAREAAPAAEDAGSSPHVEGSDKSAPRAESAVAQPDAAKLHAEALIPITPEDPTWGDRLAPVTIVEFSDLQCPYCARVQVTLEQLRTRYGKEKLRFVWKNNPLPFHERAEPAQIAALTVYYLEGQAAFSSFRERAFENREELTRENFVRWAVQAGAEEKEFEDALASPRFAQQIHRDKALARKLGMNGVPAFRINGVMISGAQPVESFAAVIEQQLLEAEALLESGVDAERLYPLLVAKNTKLQGQRQVAERAPPEPDTTVWAIPVRANDPKKGGSAPLVTIVQFSEFQCPFCKRVAPTLDRLLAKYGDDLQVVWKDNPLGFHPRAKPAAQVARAVYEAKGDSAFWKVHDAFFASQPKLEDGDLVSAALSSQVPEWRLRAALSTSKYDAKFDESMTLALDFEARGTPHFFINGRRVKGAQPDSAFEAVIEEQLEIARELLKKGTPRNEIYAKIISQGKTPPPPSKKEVGPVPSDAPVRGSAHAKVVIQVFSDFECPFCARVLPTLDEVLAKHKNVKLVWRNLPLPFHKNAQLAAEAAFEIYEQKGSAAFWRYHDKLFAGQKAPGLGSSQLETYAQELGGIDMKRFQEALASRKHRERILSDVKVAQDAGISGTPGFVINGYFVSGAQQYRSFKRAIELAEKTP